MNDQLFPLEKALSGQKTFSRNLRSLQLRARECKKSQKFLPKKSQRLLQGKLERGITEQVQKPITYMIVSVIVSARVDRSRMTFFTTTRNKCLVESSAFTCRFRGEKSHFFGGRRERKKERSGKRGKQAAFPSFLADFFRAVLNFKDFCSFSLTSFGFVDKRDKRTRSH